MFFWHFTPQFSQVTLGGESPDADSDCKNVKGLLEKKKKERERGGGSRLEVKRAKELELVVVDKKGKKKGVKGTWQ